MNSSIKNKSMKFQLFTLMIMCLLSIPAVFLKAQVLRYLWNWFINIPFELNYVISIPMAFGFILMSNLIFNKNNKPNVKIDNDEIIIQEFHNYISYNFITPLIILLFGFIIKGYL